MFTHSKSQQAVVMAAMHGFSLHITHDATFYFTVTAFFLVI